MITVNMHQAKTNLSKLISAVMDGDEVLITKAGKPVAKLLSVLAIKRKPGALKGKINIASDFNSPLPDAILNQFEGK